MPMMRYNRSIFGESKDGFWALMAAVRATEATAVSFTAADFSILDSTVCRCSVWSFLLGGDEAIVVRTPGEGGKCTGVDGRDVPQSYVGERADLIATTINAGPMGTETRNGISTRLVATMRM